MSWLINFLQSITYLVVSVFQMIIEGILGIIQIIIMIPQYINYVSNLLVILPTWLSAFCLGIIAISVIWAIRKAL